ncbi:hypothetical protein [Bosea sp. UNC402CLCol]|uniref:hypothetical protein n=1 Tax=Bosea sp. UNC402CLCol TaxID=1510531 RepID=UPI000571B5C7|nr:hypothetical protein [Bosea sp. UNC402CLCol]
MTDHLPPTIGVPLTPATFSQLTFKLRASAVRLMEEARLAGRKREVRFYEVRLRRIDADIAKYGMQR